MFGLGWCRLMGSGAMSLGLVTSVGEGMVGCLGLAGVGLYE